MKHLMRLFLLLLILLCTSCNKISLAPENNDSKEKLTVTTSAALSENNSQTDNTITSVPPFENNEEMPETTTARPNKTTADLGHSFLLKETEHVPINKKNNKEWEAYKTILSGDFSLIEDEDMRSHVKYMYQTSMDEETGTCKWRYILMDTNEDGVNELFVQYSPFGHESGFFCYKNGKVVCVFSDTVEMRAYTLPLKIGKLMHVSYGYNTSRSIANIDLMDPMYNWNIEKRYLSIDVDYEIQDRDYYNMFLGSYYLPEEGTYYFYEEIGEDGMMGEPYSLTIGEWERSMEVIESLLIPDEDWEYCSEQNNTEAAKD